MLSFFKVSQELYRLQDISFMKWTSGIGSSKKTVSPFFCVTIVSTTILYWTDITLSKMAGYSSKFDEWARRPDTKTKLALAKKNAWAQFTKQFPNADKDKFYVQTSVDEHFKISAEVLFNEGPESSVSVNVSHRKNWSQQMKKSPRFIRRLPFSAIANKNSIANSGSRVCRICAKHCQNLQSRE